MTSTRGVVRGLYVRSREHVVIAETRAAPLLDDQVRVEVEFASIKHGTMFNLMSGRSPLESRRFNTDLRLFVDDPEDGRRSLVNEYIGNMVVGTVVEVGEAVTRHARGDRVYCPGPVCDSIVQVESEVERLPDGMDQFDAVCMDPATFALAAVRDGRVAVGDHVAVFGLGAIGLFTVQLLLLSGALSVIAVDPWPHRREVAAELGATLTLDPATDVAVEVRAHLGHGVDVAIEASGRYPALQAAVRAVRNCARVVTLGFYQGGAAELTLGAEWHHNRLDLIGSMPVWGNPLRDHPSWDLDRLRSTLVQLFQRGQLRSHPVVEPVVPFESAPEAVMDLYLGRRQGIKLGVEFPAGGTPPTG